MSSGQQNDQQKGPDAQDSLRREDEDTVYVLEKPERIQGIKALQSPTTYIASIIVAFVIYHLDRLNIIAAGCQKLCDLCTCAKNCAFEKYAQVKDFTKGTPFEGDNFFLALGTICIMTILVIMKKIYAKKQLQIFLELKR